MLRTCEVRFEASRLTPSISSFQAPSAPSTCACPPSRPWLPTSSAMRMTSERMAASLRTSEFIAWARRNASPSSVLKPGPSVAMDRLRSPRASAAATAPVSPTSQARFATRAAAVPTGRATACRGAGRARPRRPARSSPADHAAGPSGALAARATRADGPLPRTERARAPRRARRPAGRGQSARAGRRACGSGAAVAAQVQIVRVPCSAPGRACLRPIRWDRWSVPAFPKR